MFLLVRILLFPFSYTVYRLPRRYQLSVSQVIGSFVYRYVRARQDVAISNLKIAFPHFSEERILTIAEKSYQNIALNILEYLVLLHFKESDYSKYFEVESLQTVRDSLNRGNGALLLGLHQGSIHFALVGFALSGFPCGVTLKIRGFLMKDLVSEVCLKFGITPIADRNNPYEIFKLLKNNKPAAFVMDQYMGSPQGVKAIFFGKPAGTAAGLAAFSVKTKLGVILTYNFRRADGKIVMVSDQPILPEEKGSKSETIYYMTNKYNAKLEQIISKYPEQWFWVHKRWKEFS